MSWSVSYIAFRILEKAYRLEAKIDSAIVSFGVAKSLVTAASAGLAVLFLFPRLGFVLLFALPLFSITLTMLARMYSDPESLRLLSFSRPTDAELHRTMRLVTVAIAPFLGPLAASGLADMFGAIFG